MSEHLETMTPDGRSTAIARWIANWTAARLEIAPTDGDTTRSFRASGLDSADLLALVDALSTWLDRPISPLVVWRHPTPAALAGHLTGGTTDPMPTVGVAPVDEPIAIVGMACRLPGGVDSPEAYWRLLLAGTDAVTEIPSERWDIDAFYSADDAPGQMNTRWGGFLDGLPDRFDPLFFGISPREAAQMDPQQRLMLELSWQALEDGRISPPTLRGDRVGVYFGVLFADYAVLQAQLGPRAVTAHTSTGGAHCIVPNRVSHLLGLQGPSMAIDTACSSSLVAVHLAAQSLRSGESRLALAGGVNLMLAPETTVGFSRLGAMSPTGRSRAFSADADGYVRGEGGGVLVLERLSDALRAGRRIWAIVRGSAVNNDGASNGLTAPNPAAQQQVIRQALAAARLGPGAVQVVEAHGTGTPLGDPIEAGALGAVYGAAPDRETPVRVGSAKTNLGHLEAAAGVAGLMKLALAVHHGMVPPSLHFDRPNPLIDFDALDLVVPTVAEPWPVAGPDGVRRGAVSSFGYGGTNGHVIVEAPPVVPTAPRFDGRRRPDATPGMAWVFSGQGGQWVGMGRGLAASHPAFRAALVDAAAAVRAAGGPDVIERIWSDDADAVDRIDLMWPTLFALQWALAEALAAEGVWPTAVMGHSIGEVAAACVAGALSLAEGARLIVSQARRVVAAAGEGAMALVGLDIADVKAEIEQLDARDALSCAIEASPRETVISGSASAVATLVDALRARGVFARPVRSSAAVHGPAMRDVFVDLADDLGEWLPREPSMALYQSTTARRLQGVADLSAAAWSRQLVVPVRFASTVATMAGDGLDLFVEIGPHPIVRRSVTRTLDALGVDGVALGLLGRGEPESAAFADALARIDAHRPTHATPRAGDDGALLVLSERGPEGLQALAGALAESLADAATEAALPAVARALTRRPHLEYRLAIAAVDRAEAIDALRSAADGVPSPAAATGAVFGPSPGVAFVFSGQGGQWAGMGRALMQTERVFRDRVMAVEAALAAVQGPSVVDALSGADGLDEVDLIQPAIFAVQVALAALWRAWGVEPVAVIGHSMGEVAAACVAGALSLTDAARIIARRSHIARRHASGRGGMAVVGLPATEVEDAIDAALPHTAGRLVVGVINSPHACVLSGGSVALDAAVALFESRGAFVRRVQVDYASHSPMMDPLAPLLAEALAGTHPRPTQIAFWSTVRDRIVEGPELDAAYWVDNLRAPVRFASGIEGLSALGIEVFVEVDPHPLLVQPVAETLAAAGVEGIALPSLRRAAAPIETLRSTAGALFTRGVPVDPAALVGGTHLADLPPRTWARSRHWIDRTPSGAVIGGRRMPSALLDGATRVDAALDRPVSLWSFTLDPAGWPMLADHVVRGQPWFPAAGFAELVRATATDRWPDRPWVVEDLKIDRPLPLTDGPVAVQVQLAEHGPGHGLIRVSSRLVSTLAGDDAEWRPHATATIGMADALDLVGGGPLELAESHARLPRQIDAEAHVEAMAARGIDYGPAFRPLHDLRCGPGVAIAELRLPQTARGGGFLTHPVLLDGGLQALIAAASRPRTQTLLPVAIGRLTPGPGGRPTWVRARIGSIDADRVRGTIELVDDEGAVSLAATGVELHCVGGAEIDRALAGRLHQQSWCAADALPRRRLNQQVLVHGHPEGPGDALAEMLTAAGAQVWRTAPGHASADLLAGTVREADAHRSRPWSDLMADHADRPSVDHIVHLGSIDPRDIDAIDAPDLIAAAEGGFGSVVSLVRGLSDDASPRLWLVTRNGVRVEEHDPLVDPRQGLVAGLARTLRYERPELRTTLVDLGGREGGELDALVAALAHSASPDRPWESEIALRGHRRYVGRVTTGAPVTPLPPTPVRITPGARALVADVVEPGPLDRIGLRPADRVPPGPGQVEICISAIGVDSADVLPHRRPGPITPGETRSMGIGAVGEVVAIGRDVSGLAPGDPVVGYVPGGMATHATCDARLVAPIPPGLDARQGATIPVAFVTAWHGLVDQARLAPGETVLIHRAADAIGQAAVQVARHRGAEIVATAGTDAQRARLRAAGVTHVFDSGSAAFVDGVRRITDGQGVDVVFDRPAGLPLRAGIDLLRPFGRLVDLGRRDRRNSDEVPVSALRHNIALHVVDIEAMANARPADLGARLRAVLELFGEAGPLQPLEFEHGAFGRLDDGVRRMAQADHPGSIVFSDVQRPARARPAPARAPVVPRHGTILLTGGAGGLGLVTAGWLIDDGATSVALMGRSAPGRLALDLAAEWRARGVTVQFVRGDVAREADIARVLAEIDGADLPLAGVVHLAGVLADSTIGRLTDETLRAVLRPKVLGAWHLDRLTRHRALDLFVLYSSITALLGSPGQASYAGANAFLDALAVRRRQRGLPASSLQWGPWSQVGLAAARTNRGDRLAGQGLGSMEPARAMAVGQAALAADTDVVALAPWDRHRWLRAWPALVGDTRMAPVETSEPTDRAADIATTLHHLPEGARRAALRDFVTGQIAGILRVSPSRVPPRRPFGSLGLDSLMVVELRGRLQRALGVSLGVSYAFDAPTVWTLTDDLLGRLGSPVPAPTMADATDAAPPTLLSSDTSVDDLTPDDLIDFISSLDDTL